MVCGVRPERRDPRAVMTNFSDCYGPSTRNGMMRNLGEFLVVLMVVLATP